MLALVSLKPCFFSRLRRGEIGIHHHIAGAYLLRYAQESSWREDNRRVSNGDQVNPVAKFRSSQAAIDLIARGEFVENAIRKDFVPSEIDRDPSGDTAGEQEAAYLSPRSLPVVLLTKCTLAQAGHLTVSWVFSSETCSRSSN